MFEHVDSGADNRLRVERFSESISRFRDRLLGSARFRRWAAAFPLTRWVARRQANQLFNLCAGFVYSQVLTACVELRVIEELAQSPRSALELAPVLGLAVPATERLLVAAAALGLVERRSGGRYGPGMLGAALVDNPGVVAMVKHHRTLYRDLCDPVALLRGEIGHASLNQYWPYAGTSESDLTDTAVTPYTNLMAQSQGMIAAEVLHAYKFDRHAVVLDVGGGDGSFLRALGSRYPQLRLMLFDLPAVVRLADQRFLASDFSSRVQTFPGDFRTGTLPRGADLISLVRVVHDHDDHIALDLLRVVYDALAPGGTVLIAEPLADTRGAESVGAAYFGMYLLAMGSGRARSMNEICELLQHAGFSNLREVPTALPMLTRIIVASRPTVKIN